MKDLDFDELDKAISSVLTTEEPAQPSVAPDAIVVNNEPDMPANTPLVESVSAPSSPSVNVPSPVTQPVVPSSPLNIQAPSTGGIIRPRTSVDRPGAAVASGPVRPTAMDIVTPPSQGATRSGITLQPVSSTVSEPTTVPSAGNDIKLIDADYDNDPVQIEQPDSEAVQSPEGWPSITPKIAVQPTVADEPTAEEAVFSVSDEKPAEDAMKESDSLEPAVQPNQGADHMFGSFGEVIETKTEDSTAILDESKDVAPIVVSDAGTTPFLSDAKVEKRPLGTSAVAPAVATPNESTSEAMPKIEEPSIHLDDGAHKLLNEHNEHIVGEPAVKKNGKSLLIGSIVFLILVIVGVAAIFLFGEQLGL